MPNNLIQSKLASIRAELVSTAKQVAIAICIANVIAIIGAVTGCTSLILDQVEQDVATSTTAPRITNHDAIKLAEFRKQSEHASQFLAKHNGGSYE